MSITRRKFIQRAAISTAVAGVLATVFTDAFAQTGKTKGSTQQAPDQPLPIEAQRTEIYNMNMSTFSAYVNTIFRVQVGLELGGVRIRLVEVTNLVPEAERARTEAEGREAFSLSFRGSVRDEFKPGTYTIEHDALGRFDMFLVKRGIVGNYRYYEAVFNRLHQ
jgi:Domain of unknown function (DUF6916)